MAFYKEDEIRLLIENWFAWTGDRKGEVSGTSPIAWTDEDYMPREERQSRVNVIRPIGAEAQLTGEALAKMDPRESLALRKRYTSSLTQALIAKKYLKCSTSTLERLLERAHPAFWQLYSDRVSGARGDRAEVEEATRTHAGARRRLPMPASK